LELNFLASGKDLLMALQILAKTKGSSSPSQTPTARHSDRNDSDVLEKRLEREHEKTVHGLKHYRSQEAGVTQEVASRAQRKDAI